MNFKVGCATDIGRKRAQNQDNVAAFPELGLFVVADGMGGHRGGETASHLAVEVIPQEIRKAQRSPGWTPRAAMIEAITHANEAIFDRSKDDPALQGMGTTAVAMLFKNDTLTIGHVGDSRCYLIRQGAIWQATRDHSLVQEKLRAGLINRSELKTDRMKNVITRSVGFEPIVNVEIYELETRAGDHLLICSDGLSGLIEDEQILSIIETGLKANQEAQTTVQQLIEAANKNGGDDNISTILVEVAG